MNSIDKRLFIQCPDKANKIIWELPYGDFVGFIGQQNSPPGNYETIKAWDSLGSFSESSKVLDLACSTGFSSRKMSYLSGCKSIGIDLSFIAVAEALRQVNQLSKERRPQYAVADACLLPFRNKTFTHIVAGSTFGFIRNRNKALQECARVLGKRGRLCIAYYFYSSCPRQPLLKELRDLIGYRPNSRRNYEYWQSFFGPSFEEVTTSISCLQFQQVDTIKAEVARFVFEESDVLSWACVSIQNSCYQRLLRTRIAINEHRKFQQVALAVWRRK